jgi:hypothetical protein
VADRVCAGSSLRHRGGGAYGVARRAARRRTRSPIRDAVRRLAAGEDDREDMRMIREQRAELAPPSNDCEPRVLLEQTTVVDPGRLGRSAGRLDSDELRAVDEVLALVLGL